MDIPFQFRSKMGVYDIQIDGVKIKATLVDPNILLETAISEFKSHIETDMPVVGVDFKTPNKDTQNPSLLLLYTNGHCLMVQLSLILRIPKCPGLFLSDPSICFVGLKIDEYFRGIRYEPRRQLRYNSASGCNKSHDSGLTGNGAEIRSLAATVLQNPPLTKCVDLFELANKCDVVDMKKPDEASKPSDWSARIFSKEEIKYAVHDAYNYHKIGKKLFGLL